MKLLSLLCCYLFFLCNDTFANASPKSLKESITAAIKLNPKTISTDELLESLHFQTLSTKANMYPSGSISCGVSYNRSQLNMTNDISRDRGSYGDCTLNARVNLYDGGASRYRYKSAEASEAATVAAYNTSDSLIPNTRGGLANQTMLNYVAVINQKEGIRISNHLLSFLYEFEKVSNDFALKSLIAEFEQEKIKYNDELSLKKEGFQYIVTLPIDENPEDFESTILSLKIPVSADDAINMAMLTGPEIIRRNLNVKMAEFDLKAIRASNGPSVDLIFNLTTSSSRDLQNRNNNSTSNNSSVGVYLNIPLGGSGYYETKASKSNLASKNSEREAAILDAKYSIREQYKKLNNLKKNYTALYASYNEQLAYVRSLVKSINEGEINNFDITKSIAAVSNLEKKAWQILEIQNQMVYKLFSISQMTGSLFN